MNSFVVRQEQCPNCASLGKDTSRDNLAIYSDGHKYCFSCKYTVFPNAIVKFKKDNEMPIEEEGVFLPMDSDINYPKRCIDWIEKYELSINDLLNNNVVWSESLQRLIFPIYGEQSVIAWQGRYFGLGISALTHKKIPKWFGRGNLKDTFNIMGRGNVLVLTEDVISAIKVSKCGAMAMPLYGCVVGRERFKRLYKMFGEEVEVRIWLDPDKRKEALKESKLGQVCGLRVSPVFSNKDPKEHSYEEIRVYLQMGCK